ncbi:MAG: hypothetical protein MJZ78_07210 [Bacteroidales bacterium]|nr:hypothetical protein [Bacteroidales bacterium]
MVYNLAKNIMRKLFGFLVIASFILTLSSCVATGMHTNTSNHAQSVAAPFDQNNFVVVKRVEGEQSCEKFLGIGGLSDSYLKESAISNMYRNANLTGSQMIVDIHVVKSRLFVLGPIYMRSIQKATGTVIEFTGPKEDIHIQNVKITE